MADPRFDGAAFAASLSTGPGVYVMRDSEGAVLYVGKARNLRRRVASYFSRTDLGPRINTLVRRVVAMEVSLTRTEAEALLLENEWIKSHRPRFNINLRDDKSYPWIKLDTSHPYPGVSFFRGRPGKKGRYFGPYANVNAVRQSLHQIYRLFGLRQCRDSVFANRSRPCLQYQIGRCSAPCVGLISAEDYQRDVDAAIDLLRGADDSVIEHLASRMKAASTAQDYERAALFRDQVRAIQEVRNQQYVVAAADEIDVVGVAMASGTAAVQVMSFRKGQNLGGRCLFLSRLPDTVTESEVVDVFLGQYYTDHQPARVLLVSHAPAQAALWPEVLRSRREDGRTVSVKWSVRGERARWIEMATHNASDALRRRLAERDQVGQGLSALADLLRLEAPPQRIECFDISHSSGQDTVGACVVFGAGGPEKAHFRTYVIQDITPGDDYAALAQVLERRYRAMVERDQPLPDLIIIDGGVGQLRRAESVMADLGLDAIPLMGVAKGRARRAGHEQLIMGTRTVVPGPAHPASHLVQQVRDHAHRLAITRHRKRRQKTAHQSVLDAIDGVGAVRRRRLLDHFGGLQGLRQASAEDLARVPGISAALAERIQQHLQQTPTEPH